MQPINHILSALENGDLQRDLQDAQKIAKLQQALQQFIEDAGFEELVCRCLSLENDILKIGINRPADMVRLRQMQPSLLAYLRNCFPNMQIKSLTFHIQP